MTIACYSFLTIPPNTVFNFNKTVRFPKKRSEAYTIKTIVSVNRSLQRLKDTKEIKKKNTINKMFKTICAEGGTLYRIFHLFMNLPLHSSS